MKSVIGAVAASLMLAGAAFAAPAAAVHTNPQWAKKPTAQELEPLYPQRARDEHVNGEATIECVVELNGALSGCSILSESPAGYGFGQATLAASSLFRMTPATENGKPVAGGQVRVPLNWRLGEAAYPNLDAVDVDVAAACFAIYYVAIETELADPSDMPVLQLSQWAGLTFGKMSMTSSNPAPIEAKMRAAIMPARLRASANRELFKAEINDCDRTMRGYFNLPPAEPSSGG